MGCVFSFLIFHTCVRGLLGQAFAGVKAMGINQHRLWPLGAYSLVSGAAITIVGVYFHVICNHKLQWML